MGHILTQLDLTAFRNYAHTRLPDLAAGFVLLTGDNGAGKTNILEAISLLVPGKGMRSAALQDLQRKSDETSPPWAIHARVSTHEGPVDLGTGYDPAKDKRIIRINGRDNARQATLGSYLACLWLTPQMDKLFLEGTAARRKLLDRLVFSLDAGHLTRLNRFERLMGERSRLLKTGNNRQNAPWLDALEVQMAETATAIIAARTDTLSRLNHTARQQDSLRPFPPLYLQLLGDVESWLLSERALTVEDKIAQALAGARETDKFSGGAKYGPHRSDLQVFDAERQLPAHLCSTGEQKALLISLILAQAQLLLAETGRAPLLLLDEIAAHLDHTRREALYAHLRALGGQIWLTGTDADVYASVLADGQHFHIAQGRAERR